MSSDLKALIVVLGIGTIVLLLARPLALRFSTAADFHRRCLLWFVLTIAGFVTPNFWWFVLVAAPLLLWATMQDSNPVALYLLLLQVVPSVFVAIPVIGINKLFGLDIYRLMSLCILIPAAWRLWTSRQATAPATAARRFELADLLLLGYGLLQTLIYVRPDMAQVTSSAVLSDSFTNALRRAFLFFIDAYVVYYVVRRYCCTPRAIAEAIVALCVCCAIAAPIAVFESLRHWLLYDGVAAHWSSSPFASTYLMRDHLLRAQAAAGDPLALGYLLAIGCGLWLFLWRYEVRLRRSAAVPCLWLGLLAAYSRGPWLGAIAIYFAYAAVSPQRSSTLLKTGGVLLAFAAALMLTPLGDKVIATIPFFGGTVDSVNFLYRRYLMAEAWQLIQQHPWLGDPFAYNKLQDMRQGQGIIDLVNTYAQVALFYGLIGLALFAGFILAPLARTYRVARSYAQSSPDLAALGAALVACIVGTLVMLANCSFIFTYSKLYFVLGGLGVAYARFGALHQQAIAATAAPTTAGVATAAGVASGAGAASAAGATSGAGTASAAHPALSPGARAYRVRTARWG